MLKNPNISEKLTLKYVFDFSIRPKTSLQDRGKTEMSLRTKTLALIAIVFVALLTLQIFSVGFILQETYQILERKDARRNLIRIKNVFDDSTNQMLTATKALAQRRDIVDFMQKTDETEERPLLSSNLFISNHWNFIALATLDGHLRLTQGFDLKKNTEAPVPELFQNRNFQVLEEGFPNAARPEFRGLILAQEGPLLLTSQLIPVGSEATPLGFLVTGRILTSDEIAFLGAKLRLDVEFNQVFKTPQEIEAHKKMPSEFEAGQARLITRNDQFADLLVTFEDFRQRPIFELKVVLKRDFYLQAQESFRFLLLTVVVLGLVFAAVMLVILEKLVLARVAGLSADVRVITASKDIKARVRELGDDELGKLSSDCNDLLQTQEQLVGQIHAEQAKTEKLLLNILPGPIAEKLKNNNASLAEKFDEATILFADIVGFTPMSSRIPPEELVQTLNLVFSSFDRLAEKYGLEKIKTIGDAYMVAGGIPDRKPNHTIAIAHMALDMLTELKILSKGRTRALQIRIGIHTGPVVAGVIGTKKFLYDLWGDTVNIASRMESSALEDTIQCSTETYRILSERFVLEPRGEINIKGRGLMNTYFLQGRRKKASPADEAA